MKTYGMREQKYKRIYEPDEKVNNCCYLCKNAVGGCNWSKDGSPVPGWEIIKTEPVREGKNEPGTKILFCPEFVQGDPLEDRMPDEEGTIRLFEAVLEGAAKDYIDALKEKRRCEKAMYNPTISNRDKERIRFEMNRANSTIISCEKLLGKHAETLRSRFYDDADDS